MPVISYEDIQSDIKRIAKVDTSQILCSEPISGFLTRPYDPYTSYINRNEAILCQDYYQSMYSQMLCGLCQNEQVLRVGSVFTSSFIRTIRFLEEHWSLLCHDIRTGTLNLTITDPLVRDVMMRTLKPDPDLVDFIELECKKDSWQGIIPMLWPNTKLIDVIVTGTISNSVGNIVSGSISVLECLNGEKQKELVDFVYVKLGRNMRWLLPLIPGSTGIRLAGFKNNAPQFNFVCRKNVILSIDSDKTDEAELQNAVENAASHLIPFDTCVAEYTSYADTTKVLGHYVLYRELNQSALTNRIPPTIFQDCCFTIEESLASTYFQHRVYEAISPLEIRIVETGTFDRRMDYAICLGTSINQYKTPWCVKSAHILELLNSRVLSSYFSPKYPTWTLNGTTRTEDFVC